MIKTIRRLSAAVAPQSDKSRTARQTWLPFGSIAVVFGLVVALSPQIPAPPSKNVLVGPAGQRLHLQRASDNLGSFTPYTPGELWGGANMVERCLPCNLEAASGKPAGQSIQPGQQVNPATGDFSYSQQLFPITATAGSLGLNLQYDAEEAKDTLGCVSGGCQPPIMVWPNFGFGWKADQFPTEYTWTNSSSGITYIQVTEPNGSQVTFQAVGTNSATVCPTGDSPSSANYTVPSNIYNEGTDAQYFCAPYRVDAQIGQFSSAYTVLYAADGKTSVTFSDAYGTPSETGNVSIQGLLTYNTVLETAGTGTCPTTATTGTVAGCWTVTDSAGRVLTLVSGTPTTNSAMNSNILEVIDPGSTQSYNIAWEPSSGSAFDEPSSIVKKADSTMGASFNWSTSTDEMTLNQTGNTASNNLGEEINYDTYGFVYSTTDATQSYTTTYSYTSEATCDLCLGLSGSPPTVQTEDTTVTYPDGEVDVDDYNDAILATSVYGTGGYQHGVAYGVSYPSSQAGPIYETFSPSSGNPTAAYLTADGNITQLTDAEGNTFTSYYNPATTASIFDELCWTAPGTYSSPTCTPPTGANATVYSYDGYGDVQSVTDPLGNETRYGYDNALLICWVAPPTISAAGSGCGATYSAPTQAPAGSTAYQYDTYGDLNCEFTAYGETDETTTEAKYDTDGNMVNSYPPDAIGFGNFTCDGTIPNSAYKTTYAYTNDQLTMKTAPNSQVTTYVYSAGMVEKEKDPTGFTLTAYFASGFPCWSSRASLTSSPGAVPYKCTNTPVGNETKTTYKDDTENVATSTDPAGNVTTNTYSNTAYPGSPTEIVDPAGNSIVFNTYDANGNLCDSGTTATTTCVSHTGDTYTTYDGLGEDVETSQDPSGNTTTYGYPTAPSAFPKLPISETDALTTHTWTYTYDADGRLEQTTDPSSPANVITTGYDRDSRKCYQEVGIVLADPCTSPPTGVDGDSAWTYNLNGTIGSMSDNLGTAQSAQTTYTYDADGNQATVEDDNGNTVNYAYNVSGQVSCVGYPGSTKIVTNCSGAASATNPIVINAYSPTNNLLSSTTDWLGHTTSYGYSPDGLNNLTSIDYPTTSADSVTYGYNADSLVNTQAYSGSSLSSVPNQTWGYNPDSLVSSATQLDAPGGTISSYSSSPSYSTPNTTLDRNWIQENTNPGVSGADTYAYNANGELASDTSPSSSSTSYGYNADVELCWSASGSSANACLSPPTGAGTTTYTSTPDGQRCWSAGSSISNAQCSTPPSSGATGYAWNAYGQLCWTGPITATPSCASPPSGVTLFTYDGSGNRTTEKSASGVTQDFTWDDAGSTPTLLQDGSNAYVYGPTLFGESVPVEQVNLSTGVASYLTSARSGVQLVLNQSGTVANESSYKTYGSQVNSSTSATPFGFQGGYTDASGLIFLVHRYYDPSTGQFISVDPKVSTTVQPYAYCGDDPLNLTDPTGQDAAGVAFLNSVSHASPQTQLLFACASHFGFDACVKYYANQNAVNAYMCAQAGSCKATFNVPNGCGFQSVAGGLECLGGAIANAADPSHIADCVTGFGGDWMTGFWIIGGTVWYVSQFIPVWDISLDAATFLGGSVAIAAGCGVGVHAGDTTVDH